MNPLKLQDTPQDQLYNWSQAYDMENLVKIVSPNEQLFFNEETIKKTCQVVNSFLEENKRQFMHYDLPALEKLQSLINEHPISKENVPSDIANLETTLEASIELAKENSKFFTNFSLLPKDLLLIVDEYYSFKDCINLILLGRDISPEVLMKVGNKMDLTEMEGFFEEAAIMSERNPDKFTKMMGLFFQVASQEALSRLRDYSRDHYSKPIEVITKQNLNKRVGSNFFKKCNLM